MNKRFYVLFLAFALTAATGVAFVIGHSTSTGASLSNSAAAALPASDFVVVIDVQRALNEAVPTILSNNPALLAKLNANLEEFEKKTGINPRMFESVAIGGSVRPTAPVSRRDANTVLIASGSFKADELLSTAFAAASKECVIEKTEQQYEGKTIFVISSVRPLKRTYTYLPYDRFGDPRSNSTPAAKEPDTSDATGRDTASASTKLVVHPAIRISGSDHSARLGASPAQKDNFAITALGQNMIAVGSLESVRAAIDASLGRNRIDDELVRLALQNPTALAGFSGRIPEGGKDKSASESVGNPFAHYFASIREFYGSFGLNGSDTESFIAVRTENAEQAHDISQAMNSLKGLASFGITQSSGPHSGSRDAVAAVLKGLTINANGNELRIDLKIPHSSLAPFIRLR